MVNATNGAMDIVASEKERPVIMIPIAQGFLKPESGSWKG
jgi:hypothetical protein